MKTITIRGISNKTISSMRKRQFKRYTKGKFILPVEEFHFSVFFGSNPSLYARGSWNEIYKNVNLVFRSTNLANMIRNNPIKGLGRHKDVAYIGGKIAMMYVSNYISRPNVYCVFDTEKEFLKFKLSR